MAENKFFKGLRAQGVANAVVSPVLGPLAGQAFSLSANPFNPQAQQAFQQTNMYKNLYNQANPLPSANVPGGMTYDRTGKMSGTPTGNPLAKYTGGSSTSSYTPSYSQPNIDLPSYLRATPPETQTINDLAALGNDYTNQYRLNSSGLSGQRTRLGSLGTLKALQDEYTSNQGILQTKLGQLETERSRENTFNQSNFDNEISLYNSQLAAQKANNATTSAKKLTATQQKTADALGSIGVSLKRYRDLVEGGSGKGGYNVLGKDSAQTRALRNALLLQIAQATEQGALQAPDKATIEAMLGGDTTKLGQGLWVRGGRGGVLGGIDEATNFLSTKYQGLGTGGAGQFGGTSDDGVDTENILSKHGL